MKYETSVFNISLRALARNEKHLGYALYVIFIVWYYDMTMRRWKSQDWIYKKMKEQSQRHTNVMVWCSVLNVYVLMLRSFYRFEYQRFAFAKAYKNQK